MVDVRIASKLAGARVVKPCQCVVNYPCCSGQSKALPSTPPVMNDLSIRQFVARVRPRGTNQALSPDIGQVATPSLGAGGSSVGRYDDGAGSGQLRHRRVGELCVHVVMPQLWTFHASEPIDILTVTEALRKLGTFSRLGRTGRRSVDRSRGQLRQHRGPRPHHCAEVHPARVDASRASSPEGIRGPRTYWLLDEAESAVRVAQGNIRKSYESMSSIMRQALEDIDNARNQEGASVRLDGLRGPRSHHGRLQSPT